MRGGGHHAANQTIGALQRKGESAALLLLLDLLPELILLLADLAARIDRGEVRHLEHLADLHLALLERGALEPLDRLFLRLHLPEPEAGHQLLRFREWTVDYGLLVPFEPDARSLGAR